MTQARSSIGPHPNLGDDEFRTFTVEAAAGRETHLRSAPGVFVAVLDFARRHKPLVTVDDNGEVETWSFDFNADGLYRLVSLRFRYKKHPQQILASGTAALCEFEPDGSFTFTPAPETTREIRVSATPSAAAHELLLVRAQAVALANTDLTSKVMRSG